MVLIGTVVVIIVVVVVLFAFPNPSFFLNLFAFSLSNRSFTSRIPVAVLIKLHRSLQEEYKGRQFPLSPLWQMSAYW